MSDHVQEVGPPICRADFVSLNDLLGRCAMAGAAWELRPLALDLLASIYRMGANLYLQQDGSAVPSGIYRLCEAHGWSVPDTEGEPPARFQASQRVQVLTQLSSLWRSGRFPAKSEPGEGKYMRLGSWVFSRRAVGVDRQVAAAIVAQVAMTRAAAAAPASAASTVAEPVPTPAPVLALVTSSTTEKPLRLGEVLPAGGAWPHKRGTSWTDAEREAMFKMRHLSKLAGVEIAGIVGCSRQCIDEQIGPAKQTKGWETKAAKSGWLPSATLLQECGFPLQPLQNLALVAGAR